MFDDSSISCERTPMQPRRAGPFFPTSSGTHTLMVKVLNQKEAASGGTYVNVNFFGNDEF